MIATVTAIGRVALYAEFLRPQRDRDFLPRRACSDAWRSAEAGQRAPPVYGVSPGPPVFGPYIPIGFPPLGFGASDLAGAATGAAAAGGGAGGC